MNDRFDLIAQTAGEWSRQPGLAAIHREAARTLCLMAHRFGSDAPTSLVAAKSIKVLGCHLCRLTGSVNCQPTAADHASCPLGFAPVRYTC